MLLKRNLEDEMENVKTIIVPVDFSENTEKLVDYALGMGKALSATLHLIHALAIYTGDGRFGMPYSSEFLADFEVNANERMTNLVSDIQRDCPGCTGEVVVGDPVDKIVEYANAKQADMIIISTHGAKGLEKILLGSVTERVVKRAHCPVLALNPFRKLK